MARIIKKGVLHAYYKTQYTHDECDSIIEFTQDDVVDGMNRKIHGQIDAFYGREGHYVSCPVCHSYIAALEVWPICVTNTKIS